MTRHLYDIAVITDYTRRKRNANQATDADEGQLPAKCTTETVDPCNAPETQQAQQTQRCQSLTPPRIHAACDAESDLKSFIDDHAACETAHSVSGYHSSVGTTLSSSGFNFSSRDSVELANALWHGEIAAESRQSQYATCQEDNGYASGFPSVQLEIQDSPSHLKPIQKKKLSTTRRNVIEKSSFSRVNVNAASFPESTDAQDDLTSSESLTSADSHFLLNSLMESSEPGDVFMSVDSVPPADMRCLPGYLLGQSEERQAIDATLEADLQRVALLLSQLDPVTAVYPGATLVGDLGGETELPQEAHGIADEVQLNPCNDLLSTNTHPSQNDESENNSNRDGTFFTAASECETADLESSTGSGESQSTSVTDVISTYSERETSTTSPDDSVNNAFQQTTAVKDVARNETNDTGLDMADVFDQSKDITHPVPSAQASFANGNRVMSTRVTRALSNATVINDSGYANSTLGQNTTNNHHHNTTKNCNSVALASNHGREDTSDVLSKLFEQYQKDILYKPIATQKKWETDSPYSCKVYHARDFMDFSTFLTPTHIPAQFLTARNVFSLVSIFQRIVRIRVQKPYQPADPSFDKNILESRAAPSRINCGNDVAPEMNEVKATDHYGTGFAFYVDSEHVEVRTHARLVSTERDAEQTELQFNIYLPDKGEWLCVDCMAQAKGFRTNAHSHTSIITCVTPVELKPLLHIFSSIPIESRRSVLEDSTYFTDSSPETSSWAKARDGGNRLGADQSSQSADDDDFHENESTSSSIPHTRSIVSDLSSLEDDEINLISENINSIRNAMRSTRNESNASVSSRNQIKNSSSSNSSRESIDLGYSEMIENPFDYCNIEESVVKDAFESVQYSEENDTEACSSSSLSPCDDNNHSQSQRDKGNDPEDVVKLEKAITPLDHPGSFCNAATDLTPSESDALLNACYDLLGIDGYRHFSSFAGDILGSSLPAKSGHLNCSIFDLPLGHWDYEAMLYVQDQRRDEYNNSSDFGTKCRHFARNTHLYHRNFNDNYNYYNDNNYGYYNSNDNYSNGNGNCNNHFNNNNVITTSDITPDINIKSNDTNTNNNGLNFGANLHQNGFDYFDGIQPSSYPLWFDFGASQEKLHSGKCDPWDTDLLGLDLNLLCVPEVDIELEKLVDDILSDDSANGALADTDAVAVGIDTKTPSASPRQDSRRQVTALIVSHPHGGFKQISHGKLSPLSRDIPDGELYDVPTCFGSCGAPVLCFNDNNDLYMTSIVHNGTSQLREMGLHQGFGLSFLPQSANEFAQCRPV